MGVGYGIRVASMEMEIGEVWGASLKEEALRYYRQLQETRDIGIRLRLINSIRDDIRGKVEMDMETQMETETRYYWEVAQAYDYAVACSRRTRW